MAKTVNIKTKIIASLRQIWRFYDPNRKKCIDEARTRRGYYKCNMCGLEVPSTVRKKNSLGKKSNIIVDHINPIIPISGWVDFNHFISHLFCSIDNLQLLCSSCSDIKTKEENKQRRIVKQQEKDSQKQKELRESWNMDVIVKNNKIYYNDIEYSERTGKPKRKKAPPSNRFETLF